METKKVKKILMKDFIKETPVGPRLQSLRLPRDLSLGGSKKLSKKIFKPNLNVSRIKDKVKDVKREKRISGCNHKIQNVQKHKFIQSTGVFSEGIGNSIRIPEKRKYTKDVEERQTKTIKLPSTQNEKIENEVSDILIKYEEDNGYDNNEENSTGFMPINWNTNDHPEKHVKDELKANCSGITEFYNDLKEMHVYRPTMSLWQLPDSFGMKSKIEKKLTDCKLVDLTEGKMGKLCVRRSGKVEIYIGNLKYELEPVEHESFTEEVVSLNAENTEEFVATVLDKIEKRFVLSPSWEYLLR